MPLKKLFRKLLVTRIRNRGAEFDKKMGFGYPEMETKQPRSKATPVKRYT